jgi:hypothetical protein
LFEDKQRFKFGGLISVFSTLIRGSKLYNFIVLLAKYDLNFIVLIFLGKTRAWTKKERKEAKIGEK